MMQWANLRSFGVLAAAMLGASCASPEADEPEDPAKVHSFWRGDGVPGKPRMVIDLTRQRLHYFKGDTLVGVSPVSSGREGYSTRTGSFRIIQKDLPHRSSFYGSFVREDGTVVQDDVDVRKDPRPPGTKFLGANMRYFMRIVGAIGMHEGYLPGYPASHGCIRLPTRMAAIFFH
jgi:lipoprotein-anchoring transpeptidase ErfK/SrfK